MSKLVSLWLIFHILAVGYLLERKPELLRAKVFAGVFVYFACAFALFAYGLRLVPQWIDPRS